MSTFDTTAGSGCASTDAHLHLTSLVTQVLLEAARRRRNDLPGLLETLQDDVLVTVGGTSHRALGWFEEDAWHHGGRRVHEVFLNADRRHAHAYLSTAEDVLVTLLHEACHVWAYTSGVKDVSRAGRYHNRAFARTAEVIGLAVDHYGMVGYSTPALSSWGRTAYGDLLVELKRGLVLTREPELRARGPRGGAELVDCPAQNTLAAPPKPSRYIFATCGCVDRRGRRATIRVARGSWRPLVTRLLHFVASWAGATVADGVGT